MTALLAIAIVVTLLIVVLLALVAVQGRGLQKLRLLAEQTRAGADGEGETTRRHVSEVERAVLAGLGGLRVQQAEAAGKLETQMVTEQGRLRTALTDERDKAAHQASLARIAPGTTAA